ncbi:hypothetical protein WR25_21915 isoform D [Diploscapter pachys]|uniref:J domain-containing protein n=1 Tax=Diploscapter pachys TaxID=2018661 RepID=A0A2A2LZA5_9BILA|nr:hypothetical protein WR25_21915 isoform B [Diploscapter pachys]PAV91336.1 hypothetical protein WR25_21915 isoform C [Diploscapter pachys]PAV91337.1 hypothetical protein WR25_21915 isoform D [Diploscapter pachys]
MARASFEYDEVGNTFYYVLVAFYALVLLPITYYFFPTGEEVKKVTLRECQCHGCGAKRQRKEANKPWKRTKKIAIYVGLTVAWIIFAFLVKKMTEIEVKHEEYNPYTVLGLDQGASTSEAKKAYHELSKVHHPDRGGDPVRFDQLAKAYQALTEEEARKNWELYGNPDGPQAKTFGIALPKWLVSEKYGTPVLALYGFILLIILPIVVGIWWYNLLKYRVDNVLSITTNVFNCFINMTPRMEINRMLIILSGALEFFKHYNNDIIERETDDLDLPRLMKSLPKVTTKSLQHPLSMPYAVKARILIHAYLNRMPLESAGLEEDQRYILTRVIRLVEEMLTCSHSLAFSFHRPIKIPPETFEKLIRLQPMFVQALLPKNSPLLQLPHITEYNLTHCRKNRIHTCADLASMQDDKRRTLLKTLTDEEYRDVLLVLATMPRIEISANVIVEGEDDAHEVTAGCYVTLKVNLKRKTLMDPVVAGLDQRLKLDEHSQEGNGKGSDGEQMSEDSDDEREGKDKDKNEDEQKENKPKRKPWEKAPQKKKGGGTKKKGNKQQQHYQQNKVVIIIS